MADRLSWQESVDICEIHAEQLVNTHWPDFSCPFCECLWIGNHEFREANVIRFLVGAWDKQQAGERALGRRFWVTRPPFWGSRARYDALLSELADLGLVVGRRGRAAGVLVAPPRVVLAVLKRRFGFGRSGASGRSGSGQTGRSGRGPGLKAAGGQM